MSNTTGIKPINIKKMLIQQKLAEQRQELKFQLQPLVKTSQRITRLFSTQDKEQATHGKVAIITVLALVLAILGKRRGGWLGKMARYTIINYPGILHKFIK